MDALWTYENDVWIQSHVFADFRKMYGIIHEIVT